MDPGAFLEELRGRPWYQGQIVHVERLPRQDAAFGELHQPLHPALEETLRSRSLLPLYSHQAEAINALLQGEHVAVATPAASGKSLCYHIPILQALLEDRATRALLLYPTKALAHDQLRTLRDLVPSGSRFRVALYDGDTPAEERAGIRRSAQVLLTNPDMLHVGVLPNHRAWAQLLQGLRYVVLDEGHVYRGVFGSHVAAVLRRLHRLCARYGSQPRFVFASATIANPANLAQRLVGMPFREFTGNGAPSGAKTFAFWNPPLQDAGDEPGPSRRRSASTEVSHILAELVGRGVRTLAFVRTRRAAELVYRAARDHLREEEAALGPGPGQAMELGSRQTLVGRLAPYRGTYLAEDRRRVERGPKEGRLLGVATTSALELGIDVGDLDASLMAGYPGSVSSTWQQAGRSGAGGTLPGHAGGSG